MTKNNNSIRTVTLTAYPGSSLSQVFDYLSEDGVGLHAQILQTVLIYHLPYVLPLDLSSSREKALASIHKLEAQAKIVRDRFGLNDDFDSSQQFPTAPNLKVDSNNDSQIGDLVDNSTPCFKAELIESDPAESVAKGDRGKWQPTLDRDSSSAGNSRVSNLGWDG